MATEVTKSKFRRSLRAFGDAVPIWAYAPGVLFFGYILFSPEVAATEAEAVTWNIAGTVFFIFTISELLFVAAKGVPAFYHEYSFGEASRRTGLSVKEIQDIILMLPYKYQWGEVRTRILASWDRSSFEQMQAVGELHEAARELAEDLRLAHYHAIDAKTTGEPYHFDLPGAERRALAKYFAAISQAQPKVKF